MWGGCGAWGGGWGWGGVVGGGLGGVGVFFFSSRRRHTRLQGDWSSDVCSSDLGAIRANVALDFGRKTYVEHLRGEPQAHTRSEERRVGKECRSRWSPYH